MQAERFQDRGPRVQVDRTHQLESEKERVSYDLMITQHRLSSLSPAGGDNSVLDALPSFSGVSPLSPRLTRRALALAEACSPQLQHTDGLPTMPPTFAVQSTGRSSTASTNDEIDKIFAPTCCEAVRPVATKVKLL